MSKGQPRQWKRIAANVGLAGATLFSLTRGGAELASGSAPVAEAQERMATSFISDAPGPVYQHDLVKLTAESPAVTGAPSAPTDHNSPP